MSPFCHSLSTKAGWVLARYNDEPMRDIRPKIGGWADATQWAFARHFTVHVESCLCGQYITVYFNGPENVVIQKDHVLTPGELQQELT